MVDRIRKDRLPRLCVIGLSTTQEGLPHMPPYRTWLGIAAGLIALSACGRSDGGGNATTPDQLSDTATAPSTARDYIAQFITDDPDACFREVSLEQPKLTGKSEAPAISGVPTRVVILIDGSGSMAARIGGRTKLALAREAALAFIDGLPPSTEASLLVFGQQGDNRETGKARSCAGIDTLVPPTQDRAALQSAVGQLRAVGWTPLAAALSRGQDLLKRSDVRGEQIIYVVSDGEETCGGDPVGVARRINGGATRAIVNIIGFGLPSREAAALQAVASAGGGTFVNLQTEQAVDRTLAAVRESNRHSANMVRASNAASGNAVRSSDAASDAALCISNIASKESLRLSNDLSRRGTEGRYPSYATEALRLMQQRHADLLQRESAFSKRLMRDDEKMRDEIDRAEAAAR
ncbi:vWA domain-containing protein [Sphingomonas crocodyli]|uniref:VWA domain-containing protein n=1 Tax=Sphingomonas crocodyli TaxID=1979270 RepID=A0A437M1B5_9SPHN|nr:VWA domain-containing protein [Sphingomonas crocodyli]RVT91314.1 VWA domain-containing protein [Sphingomonas crocodyli]